MGVLWIVGKRSDAAGERGLDRLVDRQGLLFARDVQEVPRPSDFTVVSPNSGAVHSQWLGKEVNQRGREYPL